MLPIARRLRGHSGGLVDRDPVGRLADDRQLRQLLGDRDAVALAHLARGDGDGTVVDEDALLRDQLARLAARDVRITCGDGLVETHGERGSITGRTDRIGRTDRPRGTIGRACPVLRVRSAMLGWRYLRTIRSGFAGAAARRLRSRSARGRRCRGCGGPLPSISAKRSAFSLMNSLAFSRPWPRRTSP